MHLMLFSEHPPIYASSCITISGERTEQLDIRPEHGPEIPEIPEILKSVLKCPEIH